MVTTQRDTPDWVSQVSKAAFQVPGSPFVVGSSTTHPLTVNVDATLRTIYLMLTGVSGTVAYSVTGATTGYVYSSVTGITGTVFARIPVASMFDSAATVSVTTQAASGVTAYVGVTGDMESIEATAEISPAGNLVTANATIQNTQLPISALPTLLGTVTPAAGGTVTNTYNLPTNATLIWVTTDNALNNYAITIYEGNSVGGRILHNSAARPRAQEAAYAILTTAVQVTISITNNDGQVVTYAQVAATGGLPVSISPVPGYMLTQPIILGTGFAEYAGTPAAGSGTINQVTVTVAANQVLVIDQLHIQLASNSAPTNVEAAVLVSNAAGTEVHRPLHAYAQTTGQDTSANGPIYVGPGSHLVLQTGNAGAVASVMIVSVAYHYQVQ